MTDDKVVLFGDVMHRMHVVRSVEYWGPKDVKVVMEQTSGCKCLNIHGPIDLETGRISMLETVMVDMVNTLMLSIAIEAIYSDNRSIYRFLDNACYHHVKLV